MTGAYNVAQAAFFQEDEILGKGYDARLVRRLWQYVHPYRPLFLGALGLSLASVVADLLPPLLTQLAVDHYIRPERASALTAVARANGVLLIALAYLGVLLV